ncbi:MAG: type VI secretion system tip protein VgrG, partial [Sandaracinaceae bacterium]|nr:type VI secretion system tip protein VgrG [Sandaracinaceae bacterium]
TASQAAGAVRQGSSMLGNARGGLDSLAGGFSGQHEDVTFTLEVEGHDGQWGLQHLSLTEALSTVPTCALEALYSEHVSAADLLHKNVTLTVERHLQRRSFKGIVWSARVRELDEGVTVSLQVLPAAALLGHRARSKIFQNETVPEVIKRVYADLLGDLQRLVRLEVTRSYERREYIVQYQESDLGLISRLAEEEGIFWYFDHDADDSEHEVLVVTDAVDGLRPAREDQDGSAPCHADPMQVPDHESVWDIQHYEEIAATDMVVGDYDWTNPALRVRQERTGRGSHPPALEHYDHTDALVFHNYSGRQYGGNTAAIQARLRSERLDLDRQHWTMSATVISALPGRTLAVTGSPGGEFDARFLIVSSSAQGSATAGRRGSWSSSLDVVPVSMPYRPPRRLPRPTIPGYETARVVGPSGEEIHTDEHGRVKVHFHWDRDHEREESDSSCWIRVMHNWAGPGFGTFFLPRIGMEVVVSFLGGNPDRPLITGCVYNGENAVNVDLPAKKTQSVIRTKSSLNSDGYNELRFEDAAGSEFISVHAQKDYNEKVLHNHSTVVDVDQSNTVHGKQTETVDKDQTLTVHQNRNKTVDQDETNTIHQNRTTTVDKNDKETIGEDRVLTVVGNETIEVQKERKLAVTQKTTQAHDGGRQITVKEFDILKVDAGANRNVHVTGQYNIKVDSQQYKVTQNDTEVIYLHGHIYIHSDAKVQLEAPGCMVKMEAGKIALQADNEIELHSGGATFKLKSDGTIEAQGGEKVAVSGGGAMGEWTSNGVKQTGNMVEIGADAVCKIMGTMVKIN